VGQVRKDILNGWKEIGGYVCRDIRTVERWEKQRGLPVRRVPGAGRATVYALISELDEWLENTKPEGPELVTDCPADDFTSAPEPRLHSVSRSQWTKTKAISSSGVEYFPAISATEVETMIEENGAAAAFESHTAAEATPSKTNSGRQKWMAGLTFAVAAGLLCILASPLIRSHANPAIEPLPYSLNLVGVASGVPYRSPVAGVDDLYLQGIYFYEQRTPESLGRSRDDFSAAIAKDKNYAPAYAGLSNTYNLLREYSVMPDSEAYPKAKAAAEHAVALDPKLPQAHASLGFIDFFWSWDTASAEREFRTALTLDPTSVLAHHWYGSMLIHEGRYSEAIEQLDVAQRLQPTSAAVLSTRALALGLSGRRNEAVDMLQEVINDTPGVSSPHQILAILSQIQPRDLGRFLDESRRVAELRHSDELLQISAAAEPAYRTGGENAMWQAILATEERLHPGASNRTYLMADAEANLGRNDDAIADLTQVAKRREPVLMGIKLDPNFGPLHQDPRFGRLVALMGLPPLSH
jgi:tetratricopeptide (TPR) repeat protein